MATEKIGRNTEPCECGHYHCNGVKYWAPNPYKQEIYGDEQDYFMCDGSRWECAMDI